MITSAYPTAFPITNTKKKSILSESRYREIAEFIISSIGMKAEKFITLNELLDEAEHVFFDTLGANTFWCVLQVKQDLENQGLLRKKFNSHRIQLIQINKKKLKMLGTVA